MTLLEKFGFHLRQGTLKDVVLRRFGAVPEHLRVRWHGAGSPIQGVRALVQWARIFTTHADAGAWVLSLGDGGEFHELLNTRLRREKVAFRAHAMEEIQGWQGLPAPALTAVLCGYPDARRMTQAARVITAHPLFAGIPFEYANGLDRERAVFGRLDEYAGTCFVSPVLLDEPSAYAIYEESLKRFEQKCGLRDYLDLYQCLKVVVENRVPGDIAEFGSYKGHSGYLIAQTLKALGSDKHLYMFDTFQSFPPEPLGVDHYWSRSHEVDFAQVRSKLDGLDNVTLVRGDFTETLRDSGLGAVALAYIDCDSYRATRFLLDILLSQKLSAHGVLICEDYGHPALLGNRAAVHDSLDGKPGLLRFFSQFSGLYIVAKL